MSDDYLGTNTDDDYNAGSFSSEPHGMDTGTFEKRNNPDHVLKRFKLNLLCVYEDKKTVKDEFGRLKEIVVYKPIPHVKPKISKQGVEELIAYISNLVNGHTGQANTVDLDFFKQTMHFIEDDMTIHFICKARDWGVEINDIDMILASCVHIARIFLTRTLFNKEREGYNTAYKESHETKNIPTQKQTVSQKIGEFLKRTI